MQSDKGDADVRWSKALREEIMDVNVGMRVQLLETKLTLRQIEHLKPGMIIPVKMPKETLVFVEELPTFRAKMGRTKDKLAIKITEKLKRPESMKNELSLFRRGKLMDKNPVDDDDVLDATE